MLISDITVRENDTHTEYSALLDDFRLWYRVPREFRTANSADAFVAAGFFPASLTGEAMALKPRTDVSRRLHTGIGYLQEVFACWNPAYRPFHLDADAAERAPAGQSVGAFFSGGVDGLYTACRHQAEITDLIFINGFDFEMSPERLAPHQRRLQRLAKSFGKNLITVETNFFEFNQHHRIGRIWSHGSCLASVALLLGLRKCYIASSNTYNSLHPTGTHPLTDPHWSTEATAIVHDTAAVSRARKLQALTQRPELLEQLVVCWDLPDRNCGACTKCLRTMITLRILGAETPAFPRQITTEEVARLHPMDYVDRLFFIDNLELARRVGDQPMTKALEKATRDDPLKRLIRDIDNLLFRGALVRAHRRRKADKAGEAQ